MIFSVFTASLWEVQTLGSLMVVALVSSGVAWWLQQQKVASLLVRLDRERADAQILLGNEKALALQQATLAQQNLDEVKAEGAVVEERFAMHQEAAHRREGDAASRITFLETDLGKTRGLASQLPAAQMRAGDLEKTLAAERGRVSALQQTVSLANVRVQELGQQLKDAQLKLMVHQEQARTRENELVQALASEQARLRTADDEMSRLKDLQTSYQITAEAHIAGLQRQLAAAEAKSAMEQKEFMGAVCVLPGPMAAPNEERINELEAGINLAEAAAREKAREDSLKIAELEYRLGEANDTVAKLKEQPLPGAEAETLRAELKSLQAEKESLAHDLETLKMVKAKSVEPVPEMPSQEFLLMGDGLAAK